MNFSALGTELYGTCALAEQNAYAAELSRALGDPKSAPTQLATDNKANMLVATKRGSSTRSKHLLRRYWALQQRVADGECNIYHVPTEENPADFLTKFVPLKKVRRSVKYISGGRARPKGLVKTIIERRRSTT